MAINFSNTQRVSQNTRLTTSICEGLLKALDITDLKSDASATDFANAIRAKLQYAVKSNSSQFYKHQIPVATTSGGSAAYNLIIISANNSIYTDFTKIDDTNDLIITKKIEDGESIIRTLNSSASQIDIVTVNAAGSSITKRTVYEPADGFEDYVELITESDVVIVVDNVMVLGKAEEVINSTLAIGSDEVQIEDNTLILE